MIKRYKRLKYIFEDSIEVYEYLDGRYGAPGEKRGDRKKATPDEIRKRNQWTKERRARHKLKTWFHKNDYLVLLTYRVSERPKGMKEAKKDFQKAIRQTRREYKKKGYELRWQRNIEVGERGAWHVHLVVNRIPDADLILKEAWEHGKVTFQHLYEAGGFHDLAGYITKTPETANRYNEKLRETSYSASRNLPLKEPEKERIAYWRKEPKPNKGYYIDKETYYEGINPVTGYKYRNYTMIRINRRI